MIKTIKVSNCASYNQEGISISNCNKVNFIYGHNGSGKTTISNYLQNPNLERYKNCSIEWELGTEVDVLVYNKNFRTKNLQSMPGVFTLGEDSVEQKKIIDELRNEFERRQEELLSVKNSIRKKEKEKEEEYLIFENDVWNLILKKNETDFVDAFKGLRGKKTSFAEKVLLEHEKESTLQLSREELVEKYNILFSKSQNLMSEISTFNIPDLYEIENNTIWEKVIVGNKDVDIALLINNLRNSDWVKAGMKYIGNNGICPFCQKNTIDQKITDQLNQFFSGEFERQINLVKSLCNQYKSKSNNLIEELNNCLNIVKSQQIDFDFDEYNSNVNILEKTIEININQFETKINEPSRSLVIKNSDSVIENINNIVNTYNKKVVKYNRLVSENKNQKAKLIDDIWRYLIDENSSLIKRYKDSITKIDKAINGMKKKEESLNDEISKINEQIIEESKKVISIEPTIDAINRSLNSYGFEGFKIVSSKESQNEYQIIRPNNEVVNDSLSEGEETFISFLYFVYMTRGGLNTDSIGKHKVIVIDDPICSLDSSVLYVVSSLVKELISCAKEGENNVDQVFVLTHNVYFHKEISFIDGRSKTDNKTSYWVLHKNNEISTITEYGNNNPISTSYALLWNEVKNSESISHVSLQNAMRRILENYFGTLGNSNLDRILKHFDSIEEQIICKTLFSWINDGSHSIPDDLEFCEDNGSSEKFKKVFKDIFYKTNNQYHYDVMME